MSIITNKNFYDLMERGFEINSDFSGIDMKIKTKGLLWLLNYINIEKQYGKPITLIMLKKISTFTNNHSEWRELKIQAVPIEAYNSKNYYQYIFYLNGSPPKLFTSLNPDATAINNSISLFVNNCAPFKIKDDSMIKLTFSDEQIKTLKSGQCVVEK